VVGKFPNTISGLMERALHTVETWCDEVGLLANRDKTELVNCTRKWKLLVFLNLISQELPSAVLRRSSIRGYPGFSADLEGPCGCQVEEGSQSLVGLWCDVGSEAQGSPLALCLHHSAIRHFCIPSLVARLSYG
jgi:hypothetical protein